MIGIPTQFRILERSIDHLISHDDAELNAIGTVMADNRPWAYLGATGANLADFIPATPPTPGFPVPNQYAALWQIIFEIAGGDGSDEKPGLVRILRAANDLLNDLEAAVDAESISALKDLEPRIDTITKTADQLKAIILEIRDRVPDIAGRITVGLRPAVTVEKDQMVPPAEVWGVRDFLHWKRTGRFAKALVDRARNSGDDRFLAYAYGYACSYAGKVVGSSFLNSVVGGPFRTQWWRQRWVANFMDAWVHGYYAEAAGAGPHMDGDTPVPPYDQWAALCNAGLHERIALPGTKMDPLDVMARVGRGDSMPDVLPEEFRAYWMDAYTVAYGAPPPGSPVTKDAVNGAYVMTWLVLWLQTSGEFVGCLQGFNMVPPASCGSDPVWTDPAGAAGSSGDIPSPPPPRIHHDPDIGEIISGAILAILGVGLFFAGGFVAGAAALAGGIYLVYDGVMEIDWDQLRCDLYWYKLFMHNGLMTLHELLVLGGLAHPYPSELAEDEAVVDLGGFTARYDSGRKLVKSRAGWDFPALPSPLPMWWLDPSSGIEDPLTDAWRWEEYPSFFIDDHAKNGLRPPGVRVPPPQGLIGYDAEGIPRPFGNVVANVADLFQHMDDEWPDWNLDGDRGRAHLTWVFQGGQYTLPVQIEREA